MITKPIPIEIRLDRKKRLLHVTFDDGVAYALPCEYLRVYSPSAEVRGHVPGQEVLQVGKESVNIDDIEPVGNYAVKLRFDDGHQTGIYSWDLLYKLGAERDFFWKDYLSRLEAAGHRRTQVGTEQGNQ